MESPEIIRTLEDLKQGVKEIFDSIPKDPAWLPDHEAKRFIALHRLLAKYREGTEDPQEKKRRIFQSDNYGQFVRKYLFGYKSWDEAKDNLHILFDEMASVTYERIVRSEKAAENATVFSSDIKEVHPTTRQKKALTRAEKNAISLKLGAVPAERGLTHLFWSCSQGTDARVAQGRIDYRVLWIFAVCAKKALEIGGESIIESAKDLEKADHYFQGLTEIERKEFAPSIVFTDSDFRRILGKPNVSSKHIREIVNYLPTVIMDFTSFQGFRVTNEKGEEEWADYANLRTSIARVMSIGRTKKLPKGKGVIKGEETQYEIFFMSAFGLAFLENLYKGAFVLLPKRLFTLPVRAQELFFGICWRPINKFKLVSLVNMLGWDWQKKNIWNYKKKIEALLDILKGASFIKSWEEKNLVYSIKKNSHYLSTPPSPSLPAQGETSQ